MAERKKGGRRDRTIRVDYLARVEGEGALTLRMRGREAVQVELAIFEPPRFFEAFLRGRSQMEVPDLTSRICGICPVAYMMSACEAIEAAHGLRIDGPLGELRRLLYCGEWIESHLLHVFLLQAPDLLGHPDVVAMSRDHGELVRRGLRMKKAGNAIVSLLGGREIHPINVRVGGFYRVPARAELSALLPELRWAREAAREAVAWAGTLPYPELSREREYVALRHPGEYAVLEGRMASSAGLDVDAAGFGDLVVEEQVPWSTALHARLRERGSYLCGPLSRINLNFDRLGEVAREAAAAIGFAAPCHNPFKALVARALEALDAFDRAVRIVEGYSPPARAFVEVPERSGVGAACTEAPRGTLYHRYAIDERGLIESARIMPPTSQNQSAIEEDLRALAPTLADLPLAEATRLAEQAVRSYDPCISCSAHFLRLEMEKEVP